MAALFLLTMAGTCTLSASMLLAMRQGVWEHATGASQNIARAELSEIERTLTIYDASLRSAAATLDDPALRNASPELRQLALFDRVRDTPELGPIRILTVDGLVLYDSSTLRPPSTTRAEHAAVTAARVSSSEAAIVSKPYRTEQGEEAITISHRVTTKDGMTSAVVIGTVNLNLFLAQFRELKLGPHDVVALYLVDGVVLARAPGNPMIGRSIAGSEMMRSFQGESSGDVVLHSALDGVRRVYSFRHVSGWPLFLSVGLSTQDLYRPWQRRVRTTAILIAVVTAFTAALLILLRRDLTSRLRAQKTLAASEQRYRLLAESASDVISRVDGNLVCKYVSPSCQTFGYAPGELLGRPSTDWIHEDDREAVRETLLRCMREQNEAQIVYRIRHGNGAEVWAEAHVSALEQGGYLSVLRDIDRRKRDEQNREAQREALVHLASTDGLTRLSNRRLFDEALAQACLGGDAPVSLLMMDVDFFKAYNDHYGHPAGDAALTQVAAIIRRHVKRSRDLAARYGGEEFAAILPTADLYNAIDLAQTIRTAVWEANIEHNQSPTNRLTLSVGVATVLPKTFQASHEKLLHAADRALYRAKETGRNRVMSAVVHAEV